MTNLIIGLVCLAFGAWGVVAWWDEFGAVLRGLFPIAFLLMGLAAVGAGMKRRATPKPQSQVDDGISIDDDDDESVSQYRKAG